MRAGKGTGTALPAGKKTKAPLPGGKGRAVLLAGAILLLGSLASHGRADGSRTADGGAGSVHQNRPPQLSGTTDNAGKEDDWYIGPPQLSGTIEIVGSSSMERVTNALAESFMDRHPEVTVTVQFTGSGAGIAAVAAGSADIGNSSRHIEREEEDQGVVENIVALDGIALCVDSGNALPGLTSGQVADIFTGRITNWADLNGVDTPIVVVGREAGSGTRSVFEKQFGIADRCTYANEVDSTGAVMARVASTPGAIGYVSTDIFFLEDVSASEDLPPRGGGIRDRLRLLALDGVEPDVQNIESNAYPLYRPFVMATRGEICAQNRLVQEWFAYVGGEEGRGIVKRAGLIVPE